MEFFAEIFRKFGVILRNFAEILRNAKVPPPAVGYIQLNIWLEKCSPNHRAHSVANVVQTAVQYERAAVQMEPLVQSGLGQGPEGVPLCC